MGGKLDASVFCPEVPLLDVTLPAVVRSVALGAWILVPGAYVTEASEPRMKYLRQLRETGRLVVAMCLPRNVVGTVG